VCVCVLQKVEFIFLPCPADQISFTGRGAENPSQNKRLNDYLFVKNELNSSACTAII
jgi:hypothetical protein